MKKVCFVGSLSGIFSHSYIIGLLNKGYEVVVINTSQKEHFDTFMGCDVFNSSALSSGYVNNNQKAKLKNSFLFCYIYEWYLSIRAMVRPQKNLSSFIKDKNIDVFLFFWGTSIRKEFYAIKQATKCDKHVKLILDVATYPVRDYITQYMPGCFAYFDKVFFNAFDTVLSHSKVMDEYLTSKYAVNKNRLLRFVCSFPEKAYLSEKIEVQPGKIKKILFLGTLDSSSEINNIKSEVVNLANEGLEIYVQESPTKLMHKNIKSFPPFNFASIMNGEFVNFCKNFDAVLISYGKMSSLRDKLTYPTRYAMAILQTIPIIIPKARFDSLLEIALASRNEILIYEKASEVTEYMRKETERFGYTEDCIENKISKIIEY